jgi:hypothetical protein
MTYDYDIHVTHRKTHVHICINEPITPELFDYFFTEVVEKTNTCGMDKFLFDLRRAPNKTKLFKYYELIYIRLIQLRFDRRSRLALVVSPEDMDDYRSGETMLINAGYQGALFTDELAAIEWLEK